MARSAYSLLLVNARVHPAGSAVLIRDDRISAVGEATDFRKPGIQEIDCRGGTLLPGLHDAHIHVLAAAARLSAVDCSGARSIAEVQEAVRRRAGELPTGGWVRAAGYDEGALGRHPTRWDLDAAAGERPVRLQHRSYHACTVNSAALRIAGIGPETEEPPGGVIERDLTSGEPTGLLHETAQELVRRLMPPPPQAELELGVAEVSRQLLWWGITAIQDATASNAVEDLEVFRRLQEKGLLRQRAVVMTGSVCTNAGAVKIVLDESTGRLHPPLDELRARVLEVHRAGGQVALHVVTVEALDAALDAIEYAQRTHQRPGARHRIEHCSVCTPEQARRIAALGVMVCTQPGFVHYSGDRYLSDVPPNEQPWLYPLRSLLDAGVALAGGSDCPVAPADPWAALHAAVTRRSASGKPVAPEQGATVREALRMYTSDAAAACFREHELGRIAPGYLADMVLLPVDPFTAEPPELLGLRPVLTVSGGEIIRH